MLANLLSRMKNNPDYAAAVLTGYGIIGLQIVAQIFLVPLYLDRLGHYLFGALMILFAYVSFAYQAITWLYHGLLRRLGELHAAGDHEGLSRAFTAGKLSFVGFGFVCGAILLLFEISLSTLFDDAPAEQREQIRGGLLLSIVHFMLLCELAVEITLLTVLKRQTLANLTVIISLLVSVVCVILWLSMGGGLAGVVACFVLGDLSARSFVWGARARLDVRVAWRWPAGWRDPVWSSLMSGQAKNYFFYSLIGMGLQADTLLVGMLGGSIVAAQFVLVWKIAEVLILMLARICQHLQPELISMDAKGDAARLSRVYRESTIYMLLAAASLAIGYALFGRWLVGLWIGDEAPQDILAYVLAGGAVFWLGCARLQAVFAYSQVRLKPLVRLSAAELSAKLILVFALYPYLGYLSPLVAINIVYIGGIAYGYVAMNRSLLSRRADV